MLIFIWTLDRRHMVVKASHFTKNIIFIKNSFFWQRTSKPENFSMVWHQHVRNDMRHITKNNTGLCTTTSIWARGCLNIKRPSYKCKDSHYTGRAVSRPSNLENRSLYLAKRSSYEYRVQNICHSHSIGQTERKNIHTYRGIANFDGDKDRYVCIDVFG